MNKICKMLLAAAAVAALAAPAMAADKLIVKNAAGTADVFKVDDTGAVTAANSKTVITSQGWIGAGTTSPLSILYAKGATAPESQFMLVRADSTAAGAGFIAYHNNVTAAQCTASGVPSACCTGAGTGPTCPTSVLPVANTRLGYFLFGGYGTDLVTPKNAAGMSSKAEAAWTDTVVPAYFTFETSPTVGTGRFERFRISANGNIVAGNLGGSATGALAATATDGFLYVPTVAGSLTSCATVTQYTGHAPIWFDTTNSQVCTCNGTVRKCTASMN